MSPQIIRRRVLLGGAVSALAFTPSRAAQADTTFTNFGFAATGAPTARTMPDRLADVINVKDWGAIGNGSNDDTAAIQAAINYCLSTTGGKQPGGKVFFPSGLYIISNPGLVVGSSNPNARVILVGSGSFFGCRLQGNVNGFLISKGGQTYDNLQRLESIDLFNGNATPGTGCIQLSGTVQAIRNSNMPSGMVLIDASKSNGCTIYDVVGGCNDTNTTSDGVYPTSQYGVAFYLGNNCVAQNCRLQGSTWIGFALSGYGAACIGCSAEVMTIGVRFGWTPGFSLSTSSSRSVGDTNLSFSSLPGVSIGMTVSGIGIAPGTMITSVSGGTLTIAPGLVGPISSGSIIVFTVDTPATGCVLQGLQTEEIDTPLDLFNCQACLVQGNALNGFIGYAHPQDISNMSWNPGSHVVTVTTPTVHRILPSAVDLPLLLVTSMKPVATGPDLWHPQTFVRATYLDSTRFTYPGPATDPGAWSGSISSMAWTENSRETIHGNTYAHGTVTVGITTSTALLNGTGVSLKGLNAFWGTSAGVTGGSAGSPGNFTYNLTVNINQLPAPSYSGGGTWTLTGWWAYPLRYSIRFRKVSETAIIGNSFGVASAYAEADFDYLGDANTVHASNVFMANGGGASGWQPPTATKNLAGWYFAQAGYRSLRHNSVATLPNLNGYMSFADLPGQFSDPTGIYQPGPIEGQEYDIKNGQKTNDGVTGLGAAVWGDRIMGGSNGHYRVRYGGIADPVWRRIG